MIWLLGGLVLLVAVVLAITLDGAIRRELGPVRPPRRD
jgi:hypothetical protein